jgi:hypothetical protein
MPTAVTANIPEPSDGNDHRRETDVIKFGGDGNRASSAPTAMIPVMLSPVPTLSMETTSFSVETALACSGDDGNERTGTQS